MLRISVPELSFGMDFAYTGSKFLFEGAGGENPITVEAVDEYPVQNTYSFRLRFVAAATGSLTAEWLITAGDATLEQCFISPE
jgi:hypothetical protein